MLQSCKLLSLSRLELMSYRHRLPRRRHPRWYSLNPRTSSDKESALEIAERESAYQAQRVPGAVL